MRSFTQNDSTIAARVDRRTVLSDDLLIQLIENLMFELINKNKKQHQQKQSELSH